MEHLLVVAGDIHIDEDLGLPVFFSESIVLKGGRPFYVGGKRYTKTLPVDNRKDAQAVAKSFYSKIRQEHELLLRNKIQPKSVDELLIDYIEIALPNLKPGAARSYLESITSIRTYFESRSDMQFVYQVGEGEIEDYLAWRRVNRLDNSNKPLSNRTVQKDRTVLHTIFKFAKRRKYCATNPVTDTDIPKADDFDPVILTDKQYSSLLAQCTHPMLFMYIHLLGETGLRCNSEALHLRWSDIVMDMQDFGCIKVVSGRDGHTTKSGKSRFVPITKELRPHLERHIEKYSSILYNGKPSPYVFHHRTSHVQYTEGERIKSLYNGFKDAAKKAKLSPALRQHDLRHRRVTTWLAAGHSPVAVQHAMGHSDIKTTMRYYQFLPEHLRELASGTNH